MLCEPSEAKDLALLINRFEELVDTPRRSIDSQEVFDAANEGRVDVLLLPVSSSGDSTPRKTGGVDEYLNTVVSDTLTNGGSVRFVPSGVLPSDVATAAIFRWAASEPDLAVSEGGRRSNLD